MPRKTKRYKTKKSKPLPTIYEQGATRHSKRTSKRTSERKSHSRRSQPILPRGQHSIKHLAITKAQEDEQLGCFGRFCKNIKSKFTRRTRRTRRAGTRKRTRKRKKRR